MSIMAYEQFEQCRNTNFLSKGRKVFLRYFKIKRNTQKQAEREFNRIVEHIAFVLKCIVKSSIELCILNKEATKEYGRDTFLMKMSGPLSREDYKTSLEKVRREIETRIQVYTMNQQAFQHFAKEQMKDAPRGRDVDHRQLCKIQHVNWSSMSKFDKSKWFK